ncbi:MAG TPA: LysM peptidoglycan-binding domain-containing protein [Terriglobales bacterium]|nr:LysM peptidoglycan-binding domain-containing protein [Terriglobales bacterium]
MKINRLLLVAISLAGVAGSACSGKKPVASAPAVQKTPPPPIQAVNKPRTQPGVAVANSPTPTVKPKAPAPPSQAEAKPAQPVDPVTDLIGKVEKQYQAGQQEYANGHSDLAKQHFTAAFNLLEGSPANVRADQRFEREMDRVLEGMNSLELAALQAEPPAAEEKSEPAPIDEANEVSNYPVDPNVKAKAAAEIKATHSDLPLMLTDQVASYINYFSNRGRETLEHALQRSGRYREMIERTLREEGVPQDLIYLAQAESGFHPYAVSRAGARGIWQFMGSRARAYDLHHDSWVDERQDPEKSTRAAARHLKDLYNQFGDWYLAMAAYNSGPGTVQSAVKRTGYADFWELYKRNVLPRETRNYVPIIVAVTIMAKNPEQYDLESITPDHEIAYDTVKISYPVDLRLVAEAVDTSVDELQDLNPSLLRMLTPKGRYDLHLPAGTSEKFQTAIAPIPPDMRVWWRLHKVEGDDTLMSVARRYHTTARSIAEANQIELSAELAAGAKLVVPVAPGRHASGEGQTYAKRLTVYRVRKGDTLQKVSDNLGIPPTVIRRWNRLKGESLAGRKVLYVHLPISPGAAAASRSVASKSNQSSHLAKVSSSTQNTPSSSDEKTASPKASTRRHTVRRGETLYSIANSYNTTVKAIQQTNDHVATLRPGMVLIIPPQQ